MVKFQQLVAAILILKRKIANLRAVKKLITDPVLAMKEFLVGHYTQRPWLKSNTGGIYAPITFDTTTVSPAVAEAFERLRKQLELTDPSIPIPIEFRRPAYKPKPLNLERLDPAPYVRELGSPASMTSSDRTKFRDLLARQMQALKLRHRSSMRGDSRAASNQDETTCGEPMEGIESTVNTAFTQYREALNFATPEASHAANEAIDNNEQDLIQPNEDAEVDQLADIFAALSYASHPLLQINVCLFCESEEECARVHKRW